MGPLTDVGAQPAIPVRRRLTVLAIASGVGGVLFVPFAKAGMGVQAVLSPVVLWLAFAVGSATIGLLFGWAGLRLADRVQLPMPVLRAWELDRPIDRWTWVRILMPSVVAGVLYAIGVVACVHAVGVPGNPGTLVERLLTVGFAATVPEIGIHLFAMSGLVLLLRSRWPAILLSGVLFVIVFHGSSVTDSVAISALVILFNFGFGTLTGWLYARYGFEAALATHAIGHAIVLGFN
jgi:hypothetical protein